MKAKAVIEETKGELFFQPEFPIYLNRAQESFKLAEHTHDFYEICYVAEGRGFHRVQNNIIPVNRGDLFWVPPGVSHIFRPPDTSEQSRLIVYNCIFRKDAFNRIKENEIEMLTLQECLEWKQLKEHNGEFGRLLEQMYREYMAQQAGYKLWVQSGWQQLMIAIYRRILDPAKSMKKPNNLEALMDTITAEPEKKYTLEWAADRMNMSERQLQRLFQAQTGVTFKAYVQHAKIIKCCELLRSTTMLVSEIASYIGFQDLKHFHSLFKRIIGRTPGQYRHS